MKDTARTVLTEAGINVDTALKRFLDDEEMYFEFLNSFVEDTLMSRLKQAVQNGSVDDAFEAAHALKGLCANLSIDSMSKMIVPMVEILRDRRWRAYRKILRDCHRPMKTSAQQSQKYVQCSNTAEYNELQK